MGYDNNKLIKGNGGEERMERKKHKYERWLVLSLLFVILIGLLLPLTQQVGSANLVKTFKKEMPNGQLKAIEGLYVELWQDGELVGTGITDGYGRVVFCPIEDGDYTLKFSYEGVDYEEEVAVEGQTDIENVLTPKTCWGRGRVVGI